MSVTIGREGPTQLCVPLSSLRDKAGVYLAAARYWAERALEVCERSLCRPTMTTSLARHLARINSPRARPKIGSARSPSPSTVSINHLHHQTGHPQSCRRRLARVPLVGGCTRPELRLLGRRLSTAVDATFTSDGLCGAFRRRVWAERAWGAVSPSADVQLAARLLA